jgi:hypothetical protein
MRGKAASVNHERARAAVRAIASLRWEWQAARVPRNLLSEYSVVYLVRDDRDAPPFVALTSDQSEAEKGALEWARVTFGDGDYRVAGGWSVGHMQAHSWGDVPAR